MLDFRDDSNRAKYFVSSSVSHLYEILKAHLYDRIYHSDEFSATFSYNWYHFVSYSLFVLRLFPFWHRSPYIPNHQHNVFISS